MTPGRIISGDEELRAVLTACRAVAVIGLSPKPDRDSYRVAAYLKAHDLRGYVQDVRREASGMAPLRPALYRLLGERTRYGKVTLLFGSKEPRLNNAYALKEILESPPAARSSGPRRA